MPDHACPPANHAPFPVTCPQLGAQLREHAVRAMQGGVINSQTLTHLWRMADTVDGGVGALVHHGCPDTDIPTAQCGECLLVLDAEVGGGDPMRAGTVFDAAVPDLD